MRTTYSAWETALALVFAAISVGTLVGMLLWQWASEAASRALVVGPFA